MLELAGQPALSDFRLEKLTHALRKADARVTRVEARYVYFVDLAAPLSSEHRERLEALLLSGETAGRLSKGTVKLYVVPRYGTISPWSSKATDIALAWLVARAVFGPGHPAQPAVFPAERKGCRIRRQIRLGAAELVCARWC